MVHIFLTMVGAIRAARFMSTPSTNRNHKYDTFSIARINMVGGP